MKDETVFVMEIKDGMAARRSRRVGGVSYVRITGICAFGRGNETRYHDEKSRAAVRGYRVSFSRDNPGVVVKSIVLFPYACRAVHGGYRVGIRWRRSPAWKGGLPGSWRRCGPCDRVRAHRFVREDALRGREFSPVMTGRRGGEYKNS